MLSNRAIGWAALVLIIVGVGLAVGLLIAFGNGQHPAQLDAIKTAGTIVVGTGGAAALWLTARRQQTSEVALNQKHLEQVAAEHAFAFQRQQAADTRAHLERVAAATEADAEARRITDLYTKAADQLGSDKAPVRLAGLYALERVAQDNPGQRQTIVNVVCAYLRMPYDIPGTPPDDDATREGREDYRDTVQEKQVRLTAQRVLATHLRRGWDLDHDAATFWLDINLDLTGATLVDFDLSRCQPGTVVFVGATFVGDTSFVETRFAAGPRDAVFDRAQFAGPVEFDWAQFAGHASFHGTQFARGAVFTGTQFARGAIFGGAQFAAGAGDAIFRKAQFASDALFIGAQFAGRAQFDEAQFVGDAWFHKAGFAGDAQFGEARFSRAVELDRAVTFVGQVPERACWVRLDVPDEVVSRRAWPAGWVAVPTAERPAADAEGMWGRVVREPAPDPS